MRSLALIRTRAAVMRAAIIPDWLAELVRPKPAPLPWPDMARAVLAICVPLGTAVAVGKTSIGLLPAMGRPARHADRPRGLLPEPGQGGGSYLNRVKAVSAVGVFGGAVGLAIGSAIHGRGWIAVVALMVLAAGSGVLSPVGDVGSAEREQPDVAGGDHARGGRLPATTAGYRDRGAAGRGSAGGIAAAGDPAGLGYQPGDAGAARGHGRRGAGTGPGLVARRADPGGARD